MIYFLIPVYNEAENLKPLLRNISKYLTQKKEIIIADDGSTDNTKKVISKLAETYPVKRVGYSKNRGAGYAFKFGFNFLIPKLKKNDFVVTMEGDNTSDYGILHKMISLAKNNSAVILASPHAKGGSFLGVSKSREILSKYAARLDALVFRIAPVKTYSSFYRIYPASTLKVLRAAYKDSFITSDGFSAGIELLIKLNKQNVQIMEIPSRVDWTKRKGNSKMNIVKNTANHVKLYKDYIFGKFS